jgi:hypothetical protein
LKEFVAFYKKYNSNSDDWQKKTLRKWAFSVAADVDEIFENPCKFRAVEEKCGEIFQTVYSERGFCYSFNPRYHGFDE